MGTAVHDLYEAGRLFFAVLGTRQLVEALVERGTESDLVEARLAIDRLAAASADHDWAIAEITLLRLRTLMARAVGDELGYHDALTHYRRRADSLGFEGHSAWAATIVLDPR